MSRNRLHQVASSAETEKLLRQQIEAANRTSRRSFRIAMSAFGVSLIILFFHAYNTFYKEHPLKSLLKTSIEKQEAILGLQESYANNLYSIDTSLINRITELKQDLKNDKLDRESMLRKLRRIEAKVNELEN